MIAVLRLFPVLVLVMAHISVRAQIQFVENRNQWREEVDFGVKIAGGNMYIGAGEFSYYFLDQKKIEELHDRSHYSKSESSLQSPQELINGSMITVRFQGSNPESIAEPFDQSETYFNYFIGSNPDKWASKARSYGGVKYTSLYNGIDLKLYSSGDFLKYDFIVAAGADPSVISIQYEGASELWISGEEFKVKAPEVLITEGKPEAYQIIEGVKVNVECRYAVVDNKLSFHFPNGYDASQELVIDPLLIFSTYSGSTADNWGSTATPGERGTLYSSGITHHQLGGRFPATAGAFQTTYGGIYDVAILKYDSLGRQLLYASYLGGSFSESPHSLVIDKNNDLLVLGTTSSSNFPTSATAFDRTFNGGFPTGGVISYEVGADIFIAKISRDGTQLLSSTYLGGFDNDGLNPNAGVLTVNYGDQQRGDILTDSDGNIYISTVTGSSNFPVANSFNVTYGGGLTDGVVMKLTPDLSAVIWGAFLGGSSTDAAHTIKLDKTNNLFVAGGTASPDFMVTTGTYQTIHAGSADGWIANISNDGSALIASSFTGTIDFDQIYFLELNDNDQVYVYGQTDGTFPTTPGVYRNFNAGQFIQKFSKDLTRLVFSTVVGSGRGIPDISPTAFLVNKCNNIFISGWGGLINTGEGYWPGSSTVGLPVTADAIQRTTSGSDFYFMVLTDDASQFLYGTYLGGNLSRTHVDGGTSRFDKSGIVYHAVCSGCAAFNATNLPTSDFPTTQNAWSRINRSQNCNNAAFKLDLSTLRARIQTNNVQLTSPGFNKVCIPDRIVFQNLSIGGNLYEWQMGDGTRFSRPDTSAINYQYRNPGRYTVKLKAINTGTCSGSDSTSTVVNVFRAQGKAGDDVSICGDTSVQLTASGGVGYQWVDMKNLIVSTAANAVVSPPQSTQYYVTITDVNGCKAVDTVKVAVVPKVDVQFDVSRVFKCDSRPLVKVVNLSDPDVKASIDFGDGTITGEKTTIHDYQKDGSYTIRVFAQRGACLFQRSTTLPFYNLFIPNVITPGKPDGFNDVFKITVGDQAINEPDVIVSLSVYNRWGTKVFEDNDYRNTWDGGNLTQGVYFYDVKINGETVCKNWIDIIK